jgi:hypothetical protein
MPISHPSYYATYLAKRIGTFSTLGLAEDTWALNEGVIDDRTFLQQTYDIDRERQAMFFASLDRLRRGSLVCVFDATDRIQHMFWRYLEAGHPAGRDAATAEHRHAIRELYQRNDALVGRVMAELGRGDVLMVISDHGFSSFRRGVNLNSWLREQGYLVLEAGADGSAEWLRGRGLVATGVRPRAHRHVPQPRGPRGAGHRGAGAEAAALKAGAGRKLAACRTEHAAVAIREAFDTARLYSRAVPGERPRSADRLQRRLPHVLGRRDGHRRRAGLRGQREGLERRPLHRPAPRARRVLLQSRRSRPTSPRSSTSRRRPCGCSASTRPRTWTAAAGGPRMTRRWWHRRAACWRGAMCAAASACVRRAGPQARGARDRARLRRTRLRAHRVT